MAPKATGQGKLSFGNSIQPLKKPRLLREWVNQLPFSIASEEDVLLEDELTARNRLISAEIFGEDRQACGLAIEAKDWFWQDQKHYPGWFSIHPRCAHQGF